MSLNFVSTQQFHMHAGAASQLLGDKSKLGVSITSNGLIRSIRSSETLISRTLGNELEGGLLRIYLRLFDGGAIEVHELVGSQSELQYLGSTGERARWMGRVRGLDLSLDLVVRAADQQLFWQTVCKNTGDSAVKFDCIIAEDIGLADVGAVTSNEAYVSHYVDIAKLETDAAGPVLCYRQNLSQSGGGHPWLMVGCLTGATSFATDGFDFYGNKYRSLRVPEVLSREHLPSRIRQYEFACASFASEVTTLQSEQTANVVFATQFVTSHPDATSTDDLEYFNKLQEGWSSIDEVADYTVDGQQQDREAKSIFQAAPIYHSASGAEDALRETFPGEWRHVERGVGGIHSFFVGEDTHVVTLAKEISVDRPHGSLLVGVRESGWNPDTLSTTVYMNGVFGAHTVVGNTSFHRMQTLPRDPFGLSRVSGQRIFIEQDDGWQQLGLPSFFEMSRDVCRWHYVQPNRRIIVELGLADGASAIRLNVKTQGEPKRFMVTNDMVMGSDEDQLDASVDFNPESDLVLLRSVTMDLYYVVAFSDTSPRPVVSFGDDCGSASGQLLVLTFEATDEFTITIAGSTNSSEEAIERATKAIQSSSDALPEFWTKHNLGLSLQLESEASVSRLNDAIKWFSHNAMIHYASPHGLEQYAGAAWGTRDVCQGPFEYFLAIERFDLARGIILETFARQFKHSGDWPQWFMLDGYSHVAQDHSHGDIVVWPLKALASYVLTSGDLEILNESVPYMDAELKFIDGQSLAQHIARTLDRIESEFIPGTSLIRYGNGDWDDSLQPANTELANRLVSGWTVGLLSQTLCELGEALKDFKLSDLSKRVGQLASRVEADFRKYLFKDGLVAGFILFDENYEVAVPLLHPEDETTGIKHRLIPMTRSIIAGLVSKEEAAHQMDVIHEHLYSPDGVRLMGSPAPYRGGVETFFRRAESAAFFGREIGLQYVHAHIRYAEALAMLGRGKEFYKALMVICPVQLEETVANAAPRQSNHYFSSSDADVLNRADAADRFDDILEGKVAAKGGWRVYSSGPGIYIGLVIRKLLGLRSHANGFTFDPVLPKFLDGLSVAFQIYGRSVTIEYQVSEGECGPTEITCGGEVIEAEREVHPYRRGGLMISENVLESALRTYGDRLVVKM